MRRRGVEWVGRRGVLGSRAFLVGYKCVHVCVCSRVGGGS